ncbi:transposase [Candidatus Palauibacter sp.]|uniref:transposase n=1 Tax=Candidatus Palauibacter sp. TaxID=3101350 RepID=UPI003AF1F839
MSKKARLGCGCFGLGAMFVGVVLAVSVVDDNYRTAAPAAPPPAAPRIGQLARVLEDGECALPEAVVELGKLLLGQIDELDEKIEGLDTKLRASAREDDETARLMTIPGIGPITAMALQAFAPPMESFRRGRDFSAWLGLVPRQHSTGGKPRLGRISKMGQHSPSGADTVVSVDVMDSAGAIPANLFPPIGFRPAAACGGSGLPA